MTKRMPALLDDNEWNALTRDLENGPSSEQEKHVQKMIDFADTFQVTGYDTFNTSCDRAAKKQHCTFWPVYPRQ